jgi:hypothetical protein
MNDYSEKISNNDLDIVTSDKRYTFKVIKGLKVENLV